MVGICSTTLQQTESMSDIIPAAATLVNGGAHGTLIVDGMGRIRSCCTAVEEIFGASQVRLNGRRVSEFIASLFLGGSSPSYGERYLAYLCADGAWRKFEAIDSDGRAFAVEINLSRTLTDGREVFVLNLRQPEETVCP